MEVILLERIEKLGQMGDVVKVKPGFARNYLLPQKKALRSSKENLAVFEQQKAQLEALNLKRRDEAQSVADKMAGMSLTMIRQAAESGQLYGSVTARDIRDEIKDAGFTIERGQVMLNTPIKELGTYDIEVKLHPEVKQVVGINVARSEEDAQRQKEAAEKAAKQGLVADVAEEVEEIIASADFAVEEEATEETAQEQENEEKS